MAAVLFIFVATKEKPRLHSQQTDFSRDFLKKYFFVEISLDQL